MKETDFIRQNLKKWERFEEILDDTTNTDVTDLDELFVQATDDLSYSRTYYPFRSVRVYLNGLTQRIFERVYATKKAPLQQFTYFWTDELPIVLYQARRELLFSFLFFMLCIGIGVLSSAMDAEFPKVILGDQYIAMTEENIRSGDPMKVYKAKGSLGMTLGITLNNLWVDFLTFSTGLFAGVGTLAVLLYNGIMVGAFQYFFIQKGLFWESFLTIWLHGTLEISAAVIAGAAGITMGWGLLFPKTYSRAQSFRASARRGIQIMLGVVPLTLVAGFIEGFLTRFTETPNFVRGIFILLCLAFVLVYYVWYPRKKARQASTQLLREPTIFADRDERIELNQLKTSGEIFSDAMAFFRNNMSFILKNALLTGFLYCTLSVLLLRAEFGDVFFENENPSFFSGLTRLFWQKNFDWLPFVVVLVFSINSFSVTNLFLQKHFSPSTKLFSKKNSLIFLNTILMLLALQGIIMLKEWGLLIAIFLFPALFLGIYIVGYEAKNGFAAIGRAFYLIRTGKNLGKSLFLFGAVAFFGWLLVQLSNAFITQFLVQTVGLNLSALSEDNLDMLGKIISVFVDIFAISLVFQLMLIISAIFYHYSIEAMEAPNLREALSKIGTTRRIRGLEVE
jgi:uncharacterized membrane protein SpoIIM required for sporulation